MGTDVVRVEVRRGEMLSIAYSVSLSKYFFNRNSNVTLSMGEKFTLGISCPYTELLL